MHSKLGGIFCDALLAIDPNEIDKGAEVSRGRGKSKFSAPQRAKNGDCEWNIVHYSGVHRSFLIWFYKGVHGIPSVRNFAGIFYFRTSELSLELALA
jgi:hypothetical protein